MAFGDVIQVKANDGNSPTGESTGSSTLTFEAAVTAGNSLVVALSEYPGNTFDDGPVSDDVNGAWPALIYKWGSPTTIEGAFYVFPNTAGGAITVSLPGNKRTAILEIEGVLDYSSVSGTGENASSTAITTSSGTVLDNSVSIGAVASDRNRIFTSDAPWGTQHDGINIHPSIRTDASSASISLSGSLNTSDMWSAGWVSLTEASTGPSLTITDPIIPGTTTTFSTSGFVDPLTGVRITDTEGNVKELTLASQTSVSAPAVGDLDYALFGDVTIEVYNATESAEATIAFNPPAGFNQIALEAGFATDQESFLYQYGGTPAVPDQMAYDPIASDTGETLTLQTNGYWTATGYGEWTVHSIDATDGYMEPFQFIWKSGSTPGNIISMRARRLKARANTAKPLRAR